MPSGRVESPPFGRPTQGLLFSCARADGYAGCAVYGLMITARCDFEHGKVGVFNYLPVVRFKDWANRDGGAILRTRARASISGDFRELLRQAEFSSAILDTEEWHDILERLFPAEDDSKRAKKLRAKAEAIVAKMDLIDSDVLQDPQSSEQQRLREEFTGILKRLGSELTTHSLNGYHFLPSVDPKADDHEGFVVLLRQIIHLPFRLANAISHGMSEADLEHIADCLPAARLAFDFACADFCAPVGILRSPDIEHLMQSFALLFSRIGIEDIDAEYAEGLSLRLLCQGGESQ